VLLNALIPIWLYDKYAKGAPNKRLQRTGISVPLIDNLPHDAVVSRPLKRIYKAGQGKRAHYTPQCRPAVFPGPAP
jgi:hypothetical protein